MHFNPKNIEDRIFKLKEECKKYDENIIYNSNLILQNIHPLQTFKVLETIKGNLEIIDNIFIQSLGSIKKIKGTLRIKNCPSIIDLGNIKELNKLSIEGNTSLKSFTKIKKIKLLVIDLEMNPELEEQIKKINIQCIIKIVSKKI